MKPGDRDEFFRYLVAGLSAVGADLLTYKLLLDLIGPSLAKAASFVAGTCVAYSLNKFWTFKKSGHSWPELGRFGGLYSFSLICNVAVNKIVLVVIEYQIPPLQPEYIKFKLAWLCATGTSTILNYIGQKFWVFKQSNTAVSSQPESTTD